jgi:hypothetical protein
MTTLADLIQWRDALFRARLSGVREVTDQNGESIRYGTDAEMARAIAAADAAIAGAKPSTIVFRTSKGI